MLKLVLHVDMSKNAIKTLFITKQLGYGSKTRIPYEGIGTHDSLIVTF